MWNKASTDYRRTLHVSPQNGSATFVATLWEMCSSAHKCPVWQVINGLRSDWPCPWTGQPSSRIDSDPLLELLVAVANDRVRNTWYVSVAVLLEFIMVNLVSLPLCFTVFSLLSIRGGVRLMLYSMISKQGYSGSLCNVNSYMKTS